MSKVLQAIAKWARQQPAKLAINSNLTSYSYAELANEIHQVSRVLSDYQGQTLAIDICNSPSWIIFDLVCIQNKICTVPIPAFFTTVQRQHALVSSGAVAILNDHNDGDQIAICGNQPIFIKSLMQEGKKKLPNHTAKVTYTSGSTGEPKGVCLSLSAMEQVAESLLEVLGKEIGNSTAAILPLPVLLENIAGHYTTLLAGGCYNIHTSEYIGFTKPFTPDFKRLVEYLQEIKATSCILVPELLRGLMHALATTQSSLPHMKYIAVGGSKVSDKLLEMAQKMGLPVYQGYGLSEAASVIAINRPGNNKLASVGQLLPHIKLSTSEDTELLIKNPAFLGYVGDCDAPKLFATGDLGNIDREGFVYINGRKKSLLITSLGRNISPEWPESELLTQNEIAQAVVVGDGQAYLSTLLVPSIPGLSEEQINNAVTKANQNLPQYAQIQKWHIVNPFTLKNEQLTGTGRIRRNIIANNYLSEIKNIYCESNQ